MIVEYEEGSDLLRFPDVPESSIFDEVAEIAEDVACSVARGIPEQWGAGDACQ
jgi:hypothetical protein